VARARDRVRRSGHRRGAPLREPAPAGARRPRARHVAVTSRMAAPTSPTDNARHAQDFRHDIHGLRALAVVLVVAFHAFPDRVPGGFVGVDIFFGISGYLIGGIVLRGLAAGTFDMAAFYRHRATRILPALLAVLAATCAF